MPQEIERKFLVKDHRYRQQCKAVHIHQGFLSTVKKRVVRIRITGEKAWLTMKGASVGAARAEFEYEIPRADAEFMLENLCLKPTIEKHRYKLDYKGFTWEIDEFHGENEGLVVAEIELPTENTPFSLPEWAGKEVTADPRYFNANLVKNPFRNWKE
jgi:adenylate cyclase